MRSHALLGAALLAACSQANPYNRRELNYNSSSTSPYSSTDISTTVTSLSETLSTSPEPAITSLGSLSTSPERAITQSDSTDTSTTTTSLSTPLSTSPATSLTSLTSLTTDYQSNTTAAITSTSLYPSNATTLVTTNGSTPAPTACTGCILEAYGVSSTWFSEEMSKTWTSVVVTETILTKEITYMSGSMVETVVTTTETINQTKTITVGNYTLTHTTPVFVVTPTDGIEITLPAGPTYLIYQTLYGGLYTLPKETGMPTDPYTTGVFDEAPLPTCMAQVSELEDLMPTETLDWGYFIQTVAANAPDLSDDGPLPLPAGLIDYLRQDSDIQAYFSGSDIATCTTTPLPQPIRTTYVTAPAPSTVPEQFTFSLGNPPGEPTPTTSTYLSTTYESTSTHITVRDCLRCDTAPPNNNPGPTPNPIAPPQSKPADNPPKPNNTPDLPAILASIINNNPAYTPPPNANTKDQVITIGDSVYPVHPADPTDKPNEPNQQNTPAPGAVVIGTDTLTAGQTTTINGQVVVVPTAGGGSTIIVGGSTIGVNAAPTGPAVLTVGDTTVTANSQGQFIVGTQTLTPGGPAITVDGTTMSLGPSGTVAVVNGVTQTLGSAPVITNAPALNIDGKLVAATVIGGTTEFVLGNGQTLTPGGVLTVDGTTYSMPPDGSGSTVVVNGVTSTLDVPGLLPVLTLNNNNPITATVVGGTTAYILGPGETLTPGGVITVGGTTYSMPTSGSGTVVVINGVTSTLGSGPITAAPALTINGKTYEATVIDGTTEYVLGPGTTLKPGEAVTISGTTYSLDPKGTALIINGQTSTIPKTPAKNSATTTGSGSLSTSASDSFSSTDRRDPGNYIASGIGISSKGGAMPARGGGLDKLMEGVIMGIAGWLLMFV